MFCIAAFIVFAILAVFSASFRPLAKKAWHCVLRRITLRPCDISFGEEMKSKLLSRLIFTHPRLARFLDRWIDWLSFIFVILSVWSLLYVANAGLNLWVYDTCNPQNAESCSLSGEACGIDQSTLPLMQALEEGRVPEWAAGPFVRFGQTVLRIPDRLKTWTPEDYLSPTATFLQPRDAGKPYALEVIDPGCKFCKKLTGNILRAGTAGTHNVSYLLYPIRAGTGSTKFPHSRLMASYIEATKLVPLEKEATTGDWQLLEKIFAPATGSGTDLQTQFNLTFVRSEAELELQRLLKDIGYSDAQVKQIALLAASEQVKTSLATQREIVEKRIRTIKIPTLLIHDRRFDRVVDEAKLRTFNGI